MKEINQFQRYENGGKDKTTKWGEELLSYPTEKKILSLWKDDLRNKKTEPPVTQLLTHLKRIKTTRKTYEKLKNIINPKKL